VQRAAAWIVVDATSGDVVASCNAHVPLAPASTLKVLTALALHPRLDPRARYTARPADAAIDGSKVGLVPGSVYTAQDLWLGLMLASGNDAANALATMVGGMPVAAQLMTQRARELGAADTVVRNTSGLDAPGQVSSVYDLAVFGRAVLADPALKTLVSTTRYRFPAAGKVRGTARKRFEIQNHNRLLFSYPGTTGIKNGYTSQAGGSFVASATRGGRTYVVALLKTDRQPWKMARTLLDWGFRAGASARPVGTLASGPVPAGGAQQGMPTGRPTASAPADSQGTPTGSAPGSAGGTAGPGVVTGSPAPGLTTAAAAGAVVTVAAGAGERGDGTGAAPWYLAAVAVAALLGLGLLRTRARGAAGGPGPAARRANRETAARPPTRPGHPPRS
jgi:D-alanyl-D-alanine carboxypeptidase (penicillin-binding protein 5/6)